MKIRIKSHVIVISDILLVIFIFMGILMYKQNTLSPKFGNYFNSFLLFLGIWIVISYLFKKYQPVRQRSTLTHVLIKIMLSSGVVLGIITTLMYLFRIAFYSRLVVFGTILLTTLIEILISSVYYWIKTATQGEPSDLFKPPALKTPRILLTRIIDEKKERRNLLSDSALKQRQEVILSEISHEAFDFIFRYVPLDSTKTFIVSTTSYVNIDLLSFKVIDSLVNLKRVNDIRYINKYFEAVNHKLHVGGVFADFFESKNQRKQRILAKYPPILNYIVYTFDFLIKRVFPKFHLTKRLYFFLTRGQNRVLSKAEAFGRLYSCGFEVIDELECDGHIFFIAIKTKKPVYPENATYGPLIKLERIAKNGKIIKVYKLRTMHPYSEFLQDYMYQKTGLQEGGKFKSDFRVSTLGKIFRMFWLDELPMLINLLKGDLKIVGVRPLSRHYFSLYSKKHQQRRIKYKPGLIPPFYVDNPKTISQIEASEIKYFKAYDKHPFLTDFRYFFIAIYNIIFKRYRSA